MKTNEFIPYAKQNINQSDIKSVSKALQSDIITRGPEVANFEGDIAKYCGAKYAVAFSSGTEALVAACFAAEITPYDRLICSANSFVASATCAMRFGAKVILADIDKETGCPLLDTLIAPLSDPLSRGKHMLMPVHYGGIACDMKALNMQIKTPDTVIIEDACAALGSIYPSGERVGSCAYSQMTTFSFHPAKTITTGEGGMVLTNEKKYDERLRAYRNNGITKDPEKLSIPSPGPWYFESQFIGANNNFTEMQAALGKSQFKRLGRTLEKKRKLAAKYRKELSDLPHVQLFPERYDLESALNIFFIRLDFSEINISKKELMEELYENGIGTQVHYIPIYRHPFFINVYGDLKDNFPNMEAFYNEALTLPMYADLNDSQVMKICKLVKELSSKP